MQYVVDIVFIGRDFHYMAIFVFFQHLCNIYNIYFCGLTLCIWETNSSKEKGAVTAHIVCVEGMPYSVSYASSNLITGGDGGRGHFRISCIENISSFGKQ